MMIWTTQTGIFTNKIQIKIDNIYMTEDEIDKIAQKVADLVLDGILQNADAVWHDNTELEEQKLLTELAGAMTALDFQLEAENYAACEDLKKQIIKIENKLNKFK